MQKATENKLEYIEKVLRSSAELWIVTKRYTSTLQNAIRHKNNEYGEFVQIFIAPKSNARETKELQLILEDLIRKIKLEPIREPEVKFIKAGRNYGITQAEILYQEYLPSRMIIADRVTIEKGIREIVLVLFPNELMASIFATPGITYNQMKESGRLRLSQYDKKMLEIASSNFIISN